MIPIQQYITYCSDNLGSIVALVDADGDVVERYAYDVWGEPTIYDGSGNEIDNSAVANPFMFTAREVDNLDDGDLRLQHNRHRVYHYRLGRWMTNDPSGYADGLNLYEYVKSKVIVFVDIYGLDSYASGQEEDDRPVSDVKWGYTPSFTDKDMLEISKRIYKESNNLNNLLRQQAQAIAEKQKACKRCFKNIKSVPRGTQITPYHPIGTYSPILNNTVITATKGGTIENKGVKIKINENTTYIFMGIQTTVEYRAKLIKREFYCCKQPYDNPDQIPGAMPYKSSNPNCKSLGVFITDGDLDLRYNSSGTIVHEETGTSISISIGIPVTIPKTKQEVKFRVDY